MGRPQPLVAGQPLIGGVALQRETISLLAASGAGVAFFSRGHADRQSGHRKTSSNAMSRGRPHRLSPAWTLRRSKLPPQTKGYLTHGQEALETLGGFLDVAHRRLGALEVDPRLPPDRKQQ